MDEETLVREAVKLARKQGVLFDEGSPRFRPEVSPQRYAVGIVANRTPNSSGILPIDEHFKTLRGLTVIRLANRFIRIFNELNIENQATEINEDH